ncbi:MAG: hypothetical protein IAF38_06360 [Bacteroidia bacterium]|nr:hypothetical protein [Bacteroidia bacterium]
MNKIFSFSVNKVLFLAMIFLLSGFAPNSIKDVELDARVKLHYTELQLAKLKLTAPYKLEQLNFQYTKSFTIYNTKGKPLTTDPKKFDVYNFESFRKEVDKVTFTLTRGGDVVELMGRTELKLEYDKIQASYSDK